jgi:hypothetical protein
MKIFLAALLVFAASGCSKHAGPAGGAVAVPAAVHPSRMLDAVVPGGSAEPEARRYIASKHEIELSAPAASLQQHFAAIQAECLKLGCEILEARQIVEAPHQSAQASLTARVPPKSFDTFLASAQTQGKMLSHHSSSEDKTADVIDVEARIKNLEALRDRVKELLGKRAGNLKETLEAEKQLAETQSELDSINGQRRVLAKQTDMIRVEIKIVAQSLAAEKSFAAPVSEAFKDSGLVFMSSLGTLITLLIGALPWLALLGVLIYMVRRLRRGRAAAPAKVKV